MKINSALYISIFILFIAIFSGCKKDHVTVELEKSDKKAFTAFGFKKTNNSALTEDLSGTIEQDTIFIQAISGTSLMLKPEFAFDGIEVRANGQVQESTKSEQDFTKPVIYTVKAENGSTKNYVVVFGSQIPVLQITTEGNAAIAKDDYVKGTLKIQGIQANIFSFEGAMKIKGRGNSTWLMDKKPYKIKLDAKASLLGLPADKTWVLLANYADKTMMRNEMAFEVSRRLGMPYTPASRYVEVILNGKYNGVYELAEQVEVAPHKVNVEEQAKNATNPAEITGGYHLEIDGYAYAEPFWLQTPKGLKLTVKYPEPEDMSDAQKKYIGDYVNQFEAALFATNFTDPVSGYRKYFDVDSYVNYFITSEIMGNSDMYWSTNIFKKRQGKLTTGPVWDLDLALNNDNRLGDATQKMMLDAAHDPKIWGIRLMQDPAFRKAVRTRWNSLKTAQIFTLPAYVDQLQKQLNPVQAKNFERWDILNKSVYFNYQVAGSYQGEVDYMRSTLQKRIQWLDGVINGSRFN